MTERNALSKRHFATAQESLDAISRLQDHDSYKLAFADPGFLMQDELRHVRLQLEYLKPQLVLDQHQINATIVVFGSARFLAPADAAKQLSEVKQYVMTEPDNPAAIHALQQAERDLKNSRYYTAAQEFARLVT